MKIQNKKMYILLYNDNSNTDKTPKNQCSPATIKVGTIQYKIPMFAIIPARKLKNKTFLIIFFCIERIENIKGAKEIKAKILFPNFGKEKNKKIPLNTADKIW